MAPPPHGRPVVTQPQQAWLLSPRHSAPACERQGAHQRVDGTALARQLAEDGRKDDGNLRFVAVVQTDRQNHLTVIELWRDRKASEAHGVAAHTPTARSSQCEWGRYDERFYRSVD
jgi:quinol monooxygenase YgiN